jgi:hypothetical protein
MQPAKSFNKYCKEQFILVDVSDLRQVSSINKTDRHDITEILLKVALNTITVTIITTASSHVNGSDMVY